MDCTGGAAPARARISGSIVTSTPAKLRAASIGGAPRATIISMSANRNGKPRIRSGSGPTVRPRWCSPRRSSGKRNSTARSIIAFALAEIMVEGGERVGIPGLMRPTASRNVIDKMAQALIHDTERTREPAADLRALAAVGSRDAVGFLEPDRRGEGKARAAVRLARARSCAADRRSGGRDIPLSRPHRVSRSGRTRQRHRRTRGILARRLCGAARAPSRRNPRRNRSSRLELHHPSHRPPGERTRAGAACAHG